MLVLDPRINGYEHWLEDKRSIKNIFLKLGQIKNEILQPNLGMPLRGSRNIDSNFLVTFYCFYMVFRKAQICPRKGNVDAHLFQPISAINQSSNHNLVA